MATIKQIQLGSTTYDLLSRGPFYGTCSTAAGTNPKVVSCSDFTSADLVAGAMIVVKNTTANTGAVTAIQLDVNSTGAKNVKKIYNGALSDLSATGEFGAYTMTFVYDGSYWVLQNTDYNTTTSHTHDYSKVSFTQTNTSGDEIGKITIDGTTTTLYADSNTDAKVDQVLTSTNSNYPVIFAYDTSTTTTTTRNNTVRRDNDFYYNPSGNKLTVPNLAVTAATITTINGVSVGSSPKFTDTTYTLSSLGAAAASHTHDYSKVTASSSISTGTTIGTITVNNNGTNTTTTLKAWQPGTNFKTVLDSTSSSFDNLLDGGVATADDYMLPLIDDTSTSGRGVAWFSSSEFDVGVIKSLSVPTSNTTTYYLRGDLSWATITAGTDDKVAQNTTTTSGAYPLLASTQAGRSSWADGTRGSFVNAQFCVNPSNAKVTVGGSTVGLSTGGGSGYLLYDETGGKFYGGLQYGSLGTTSEVGTGILVLGNNTAEGTAGNAGGMVKLYGSNSYAVSIFPQDQAADRMYSIPDAGGDADFVMTAGNQGIAGNKTFSGTVQTDVLSVQDRLVGRYTTTVNTTTSVQQYNIFSAVPTTNGVDNQIAFVIVS